LILLILLEAGILILILESRPLYITAQLITVWKAVELQLMLFSRRFIDITHLFNVGDVFFQSGSGLGGSSAIDCATSLYVRHQR